jgi:flagellar hook-associated protein 1 FlgK
LNEPYYLNIYQSLDGTPSGPITSRISGGELGALLELRDTRTEAYRDKLDEFAFTLADRVNSVHMAGRGLDDANARRFFIDPDLGGGNVPGDAIADVEGAAAEIEINADLVSNPRHLAAGVASADATPPGAALPGDNTNALALAAVESLSSPFFRVGDGAGPPTGPNQSLGSFLDSLSGTLGSELQATQRDLEQGELIIAQLEDQRGIISGVSMDEEITKLIAYERAFQASARIIQTVDEMMETLLAM